MIDAVLTRIRQVDLIGHDAPGWVEVLSPAGGITTQLVDNPVALVDCAFRAESGEWENVLGIPLNGREGRPLVEVHPACSVLLELRWDDAFAVPRAATLEASTWSVRPVESSRTPDVIVEADWWKIVLWLHDRETNVGSLMLQPDCRVEGDLCSLSVVEAVVSAEPLDERPGTLDLLIRLEEQARRW